MKKRDLFSELSGGVDALKKERAGKLTLKKYIPAFPRQIAIVFVCAKSLESSTATVFNVAGAGHPMSGAILYRSKYISSLLYPQVSVHVSSALYTRTILNILDAY